MNPSTIPEILNLPNDAVVYLFRGRIKTVYARKSGKISKGPRIGEPWALQGIEIECGGQTIEAKLKDRDDEIPKSWKGRQIELAAHEGDRGWSGLYAWDDEYQNNVTRKLKVTGTAEVSLLEGGPGYSDAPPPAQRQPEPPPRTNPAAVQQARQAPPAQTQYEKPNQRQQAPEQPVARTDAEMIKKTRVKAYQIANLQLLSLNTTANYTAVRFAEKTGRELTITEIHALAMNMTIELMRSGAAWEMPGHEMPPLKPTTHQPSDNDGHAG